MQHVFTFSCAAQSPNRTSFWLQMSILTITFYSSPTKRPGAHYDTACNLLKATVSALRSFDWLFTAISITVVERSINQASWPVHWRISGIIYTISSVFCTHCPILANYWRRLWPKTKHKWMNEYYLLTMGSAYRLCWLCS